VGGIGLNVQIDRIDEMPDGRRLVLDYKTGRGLSVDAWFSERPDEPQLPIYAVTSPQPVHAVGFVRVRHGDPGFVCITDGIDVPRKLPGGVRAPRPQLSFAGYVDEMAGREFKSRDEVLASWNQTLDTLGARFRAGQAVVDPKDPKSTCQHCELPALCRIQPTAHWGDVEPGGGNGGPA
jgi:hypothetical protein